MSSPLAASSRTNSGGGGGRPPSPSFRDLFSFFGSSKKSRSSSSGGGGDSAGGSASSKRQAEAVDTGAGGGSSGGDGSSSVPDAAATAKLEAEARLRATLRDKDTISALFHTRFVPSAPPPQALNVVRWAQERVQVHDFIAGKFEDSPIAFIRMPKMNTLKTEAQSKGERRASQNHTDTSRISRAVNITADLFVVHEAVFLKLQGTSFNLPGAPATTNMAAGAACIKAAIGDLDMRFPGRVKVVLAKLEMCGVERPERVDAHGIVVINGMKEAMEMAAAFKTQLVVRGAMCPAMHATDRTRVAVESTGDTAQRVYEWVQYIIKANSSHQQHIDRPRTRATLQMANIPIVGNEDDMLFLYHSRQG
eukprot:TRINITY_DN915_c1_g1_i1.p2 TRINITY_DN915_c1_g1~~TRINITY_DN915_c1_g1_i1.p2  ORF type:complete len:364 (+),score=123.04 TRINITY_DN915_c1_g1_i1:97-1188(+)